MLRDAAIVAGTVVVAVPATLVALFLYARRKMRAMRGGMIR